MHPFPTAADLQFLIGAEMGQIVLDPWQVQFRFVSGGQITTEGRIEHIDEKGKAHSHDCRNMTGTPLFLHQLLQQRIAELDVEPFCLSLMMDSGSVLRVFSDEGPYECGHIVPPDATGLIVF